MTGATVGGILGGIGIFLVGMVLLTEGVKAAAGDALRALLQRFTRGPGTAFASGAAVTALVQSSSATTLTTIGFVSAGLLTFPQAVGVILGANVGTTSTGWLVSTLGFKVSLATIAYPLVGAGALARLLGSGRWSHAGLALAGFGLIFVGIDVLQTGMASLATRMDPGSFPGATLAGRAALVGVGVGMTVVLQSSSAAVATTLAGLHAGTIGLEQAALLVIGQNLGTTFTAALASMGGSVPVRRTALAHILFNGGTAVVALAAFPILLGGALAVSGESDPEIAVALFHTAFNLIGVGLFLPFTPRFAGFIERLVPERGPTLTRHLDPSVAQMPAVALEAARRSATGVLFLLFGRAARILLGEDRPGGAAGATLAAQGGAALGEIRTFMGEIRTPESAGETHDRHLSLLHAVDHLERFLDALGDLERQSVAGAEGSIRQARRTLAHALTGDEITWEAEGAPGRGPVLGGGGWGTPPGSDLEAIAASLADLRRSERARVLEATARGEVEPGEAWHAIEALKTLDRLGYHAWRAHHHLGRMRTNGVEEVRAEGVGATVRSEAFEDREDGRVAP